MKKGNNYYIFYFNSIFEPMVVLLRYIRLNIHWLCLAFLTTIMCCKKDHHSTSAACFTVNDSTAVVYDTISFYNCSAKADSLVYSFGDGQFSNSANPMHVYTVPGTYTAKLTTYNGRDSNSVTRGIIVTHGIYGNYYLFGSSSCADSVSVIFYGANPSDFEVCLNGYYCLVASKNNGLSFSIADSTGNSGEFNSEYGTGYISANLDTISFSYSSYVYFFTGDTTTYCSFTGIRH